MLSDKEMAEQLMIRTQRANKSLRNKSLRNRKNPITFNTELAAQRARHTQQRIRENKERKIRNKESRKKNNNNNNNNNNNK
jgi:hypothetical protein